MQLLSPVTDRELAWGKIVGFAAVVGVGVLDLPRGGGCASRIPVRRPYWIAVVLGGDRRRSF